MTAYNIIQQHPEWVTSERIPRAAIQNEARRYVRELEGSKNFSSLITEDLDDLLRQRDATNDFAGVVADGKTAQANTDSPEYLTDRRKAQIYAIFIKAVISELSGKAICTAAQVEEWRERYAVKLEGLKGKTTTAKAGNETRSLEPILYSRAKQIYKALIEYSLIDCEESDFTNLFCTRPSKYNDNTPTPAKINWKGNIKRELALFWEGMCFFAGYSSTKWGQLPLYINSELQTNKDDLNEIKKDQNAYLSHKIKRIFDCILEKENEENTYKLADAIAEAKNKKWIKDLLR